MAHDRPPGTDDALAEAAEGEVTKRRLERLPPGHPSSAADAVAPESPDVPRSDIPDSRRPLTNIEHNDHVAKVRDHLEKARAENLATEFQHTTDADHEQWTQERTLMHDAILADVYEAARDVPCERRAILAGGLPGAGKTTVLEQHAGVDRSRYLTVNPDDIKVELAQRGMIPNIPGLTPMEASELVHEESSHVAKRLASRAIREGKNVIWDITMSSEESTLRRISDLRAHGYSRVEGIFVDIPVDTSIRRTDSRHRADHDKYRAGDGLGGRYIAPEIVSAQADRGFGSRNRRTFEHIKPQLDDWRRYDNSVDGRDPILADSKEKGER